MTPRRRALRNRKEARDDPRVSAAVADKELVKLALSHAPKLRESCRDEEGLPCDDDIAIGLLIHAAASKIVARCPTYQVMDLVCRRMQAGLAEHINEFLMEGRQPGTRLN